MSGPIRILVIDDNPSIAMLDRDELEDAGYDVALAFDGATALTMIRDGDPFDLVILDLNMPGMDSFETIGKILDIDSAMPVIIHSAEPDRNDFMTWAAEAYVCKSHDFSELLRTVAEVLARRGIWPRS